MLVRRRDSRRIASPTRSVPADMHVDVNYRLAGYVPAVLLFTATIACRPASSAADTGTQSGYYDSNRTYWSGVSSANGGHGNHAKGGHGHGGNGHKHGHH